MDFKNSFLGDETKVGPQSFHMTDIAADQGNVTVNFHYCALVSAWKKLGFSDETCALLCDMAMGRRPRHMPRRWALTLTLTDTIAKGCATCKLHFHK